MEQNLKKDKKPTGNAFDALIKMINRSDKSERDARAALLKQGFEPKEADGAIEKAKEYGYLSDAKFSERYVFFKKSAKGKYRLKQELLRKGIDEETADAALETYTDSAESCENIAIRYMKNKVWEPKTANRLLRHLIQRGFSYDEARRASEVAARTADSGEEFEIPFE